MARKPRKPKVKRVRRPRVQQPFPRVKTTDKAWSRDIHLASRSSAKAKVVKSVIPITLRVKDSVTYSFNYANWRLRLKRGDQCTTPMFGVKYSSKASELDMTIQGKGPMDGYFRSAIGYPSQIFPNVPSTVIDSIAERKAASAFLKSYLKATQTWAGGAAIAEFRETVHMLARPIGTLYRHTWTFIGQVRRLRRVYARDPVRYGQLLASLWLTYSFGVRPFANDVNSANEAINVLATKLGSKARHRIIGTGKNVVLTSSTFNGVSHFAPAMQTVDQFQIYEVRYLGSVRCRPPGAGSIANNFGVGFEDILPSVWEGVPWSWLVDYFTNVNEMLDSIRLLTADFAWCARSVRNRRVKQLYAAVDGLPASERYAYHTPRIRGGQGYYQAVVVDRMPTAVPYPSWQFRIPGLLSQFANVSALTAAISGSKPRKPGYRGR